MTGTGYPRAILFAVLAAASLALAACGEAKYEERVNPNEINPLDPNRPTVFGPGGMDNLFGTKRGGADSGSGIGVNSFLWRASLDTVSFMPINSADAFGGVIITDWFVFPDSPAERFKLNVYILGRALRADGVRVSAFRQAREGDGTWRDAAVEKQVNAKIEDSILTRARQLRQETLANQSK